jgi:lipoprotein signal peptidase
MKPMTERSYRGLLWGLALLGFALDQGTKYGAFRYLNGVAEEQHSTSGVHPVIPDIFDLHADFGEAAQPDHALASLRNWSGSHLPAVNHGALFGWLREQETLANTTFAAVSVAAALAIAYWSLRRSTARDRALCIALGLILAGTLGNLYDRIVFGGVRDFLHWHYKRAFDWPVFNVADCCLVVGALLLLAQAFWSHSTATAPSASAPGSLSPEMAEAK